MKVSEMIEQVDQWDDTGQFCGVGRDALAVDYGTKICARREGDFGLAVYAVESDRYLIMQTEYAKKMVGFTGIYCDSVTDLKEALDGYKGMITTPLP